MPRYRYTVVLSVLTFLAIGSTARATNAILGEWEAIYPTSTLPARMQATAGNQCFVCHSPDGFDQPGNCYREALITLITGGTSSFDAIVLLDTEDSDGDGFTNGEEATMAYWNAPGQIGYNQGLIGPTGTDPCGNDPNAPVTGMDETPIIVEPVPAVSQWGVLVMVLLVASAGTLAFPRRRTEAA